MKTWLLILLLFFISTVWAMVGDYDPTMKPTYSLPYAEKEIDTNHVPRYIEGEKFTNFRDGRLIIMLCNECANEKNCKKYCEEKP